MRVAILHNAVPDDAPLEDQDTLVQVEAVAAALVRLGTRAGDRRPARSIWRPCATNCCGCGPTWSSIWSNRWPTPTRWSTCRWPCSTCWACPTRGSRTEALFLTTHKLLAKERLRAGRPAHAGLDRKQSNHPRRTRRIRRIQCLIFVLFVFFVDHQRRLGPGLARHGRRRRAARRRCGRGAPTAATSGRAAVRPALFRRAVHRRPRVQPLGAGRSGRARGAAAGRNRLLRLSARQAAHRRAIGRSGRPIRSSITTRPAASISTAADGPLLDELRRLARQLLDAVRASRLGPGRFSRRCGRAAVDSGDQRQPVPLARRRLCRGAASRPSIPFDEAIRRILEEAI